MKKIIYLLLAAVAIVLAACGDGNNPTIDNNGALKGKFTVNDQGKQVRFSKGNLQYQASTNTWRFATNQWDFVGDGQYGTVLEGVKKCDNTQIDENYEGWIDLFGWGTGSAPTKSVTDANKYKIFVEWGSNAISNGGNQAHLWRTLTLDEWRYILHGRLGEHSYELWDQATVNGVHGLIILPDNWAEVKPSSIEFTRDGSATWTKHEYTDTDDEWRAMEKAGAIFLPVAGFRLGNTINELLEKGYYWFSPTEEEVPYTCFSKNGITTYPYSSSVPYGYSVRLVQDVQ